MFAPSIWCSDCIALLNGSAAFGLDIRHDDYRGIFLLRPVNNSTSREKRSRYPVALLMSYLYRTISQQIGVTTVSYPTKPRPRVSQLDSSDYCAPTVYASEVGAPVLIVCTAPPVIPFDASVPRLLICRHLFAWNDVSSASSRSSRTAQCSTRFLTIIAPDKTTHTKHLEWWEDGRE